MADGSAGSRFSEQSAGYLNTCLNNEALPERRRPSGHGMAFPGLGDKGLDGGEGEVRAVAEDGVTCPGKSHEAGGASREPAG